MDPLRFPWQPLGALLVDVGLITPSQLEQALAEQRRSGRLLGEILVSAGYLSALSLAQALTAQHGVELQAGEGSIGRPEPQPERSAWRALGTLLLEEGFLSTATLELALAEQRRHPERRLGEILVDRGYLSGPELARALGHQHGVALEQDDRLESAVRRSSREDPVYRVYEVEPGSSATAPLFQSTNFLEAADFAFEHIDAREPAMLEIHRGDETVWTYSASEAAGGADAQPLVDTFGFDPTRWDPGSRLGRA